MTIKIKTYETNKTITLDGTLSLLSLFKIIIDGIVRVALFFVQFE